MKTLIEKVKSLPKNITRTQFSELAEEVSSLTIEEWIDLSEENHPFISGIARVLLNEKKEKDFKFIHTEMSFSELASKQGATVKGDTYVTNDGVVRYWSQAGVTRSGIDSVMFHFVISNKPVTKAQEDACLKDWARLNTKYSNY